jgi:large subunit ribosomal protein L9
MPIEVILKKPIQGLGSESDIVKVKPGYARNYLLPRDLAVQATGASRKQIENLKRQRAEREASELNAAQELAGRLSKITLTFQMQSSDGEVRKVFGSVTASEIVERLASQNIVVDKRQLELPRALKDLGEHQITAKLDQGVEAKFAVILVNPEAAAPVAEAESGKKRKTFSKGKSKASAE